MPSVSITTPAPSRLLTSSQAVMDAASGAGLDPAILQTFAASLSALAERVAGRVFAQERIVETHTLDRVPNSLFLDRLPLATVHSLTVNGTALVADESYYVVSAAQGEILLTSTGDALSGVGWSTSRHPVRIVIDYTGGYVLPDWPSQTATLPADIQIAAANAVKAVAEQRQRDSSITSERIGDYAVSYGGGAAGGSGGSAAAGIPAVQALLEIAAAYRRVTV